MSNIYALIVAAPLTAKKYCRGGESNWELRHIRAKYGMKDPDGERPITAKVGGCFAIIIVDLYPHMLKTLLSVVRGKPVEGVPSPESSAQMKAFQKKLDKQIPYVYGDSQSQAPWLWQIPEEIIEHLAELETKREFLDLAKLWQESHDEYTQPWCSLKVTKNLLRNLQLASVEAVNSKKKAFLYCST
ncbi:MAG: hypothetical protein DKT66_23080 [Candidatus Melainabacteria bacterium]|nr:MAG: hypothetical protein DKT66_23080 [Candidatus Melainabacteria bacterium]